MVSDRSFDPGLQGGLVDQSDGNAVSGGCFGAGGELG
jgi:hypothetical protein